MITGKLLTVTIVTANRPLEQFVLNLKKVKNINEVEVKIYDNSKDPNLVIKNGALASSSGFYHEYIENFIDCRNKAVQDCTTEYFTILDDDDKFDETAINQMINAINIYHADFISFGVEKIGRKGNFDNKSKQFKNDLTKLMMLNTFQNYSKDRLSKVYLWNCANVYKTSLLKSLTYGWKYKGCDDILPITEAYLRAESVVRINSIVYWYPNQSYIGSEKPLIEKQHLEQYMYESYKLLKEMFDKDLIKNLIVNKAIRNSMAQLDLFDNFYSEKLKSLTYVYPKSKK